MGERAQRTLERGAEVGAAAGDAGRIGVADEVGVGARIARERDEEARVSGERHQREAIAARASGERADLMPCAREACRRDVRGEHRAGHVEADDDVTATVLDRALGRAPDRLRDREQSEQQRRGEPTAPACPHRDIELAGDERDPRSDHAPEATCARPVQQEQDDPDDSRRGEERQQLRVQERRTAAHGATSSAVASSSRPRTNSASAAHRNGRKRSRQAKRGSSIGTVSSASIRA